MVMDVDEPRHDKLTAHVFEPVKRTVGNALTNLGDEPILDYDMGVAQDAIGVIACVQSADVMKQLSNFRAPSHDA